MNRRADAPYRRRYSDGRVVWIARYRHPITGDRCYAHPSWNRNKATFELKRDAQRAINEAIEEALKPESRTDTVAGYALVWLDRHPRSERTNKTHEHRLSRVMDYEILGKKLAYYELSELRVRHANALYDRLLNEGRALRGAKGILSTYSAMLEDAISDELAASNPFRQVKFRKNDPRIQKKPKKREIYTFNEMHHFAASGETRQARVMIRVLSDCGLRLGEMLALGRYALNGNVLQVRGTAHEGRVLEEDGETKKHHRDVPVPADLGAMLSAYLEHHDHPTLMFPTISGRVWRESNFYRDVWGPTQEAAGLSIAPHDMRHSYLSQVVAAGIDLADVARTAGHNVQTLIDTYTHPLGRSDDEIREAIANGR